MTNTVTNGVTNATPTQPIPSHPLPAFKSLVETSHQPLQNRNAKAARQAQRKSVDEMMPREIEVCCFPPCGEPVHRTHFCRTHHRRWVKGGNQGSRKRPADVDARFDALGWTVREVIPALGPCWEWNGHCNSQGYGVFLAGWTRAAHRFALARVSGTVPNQACHRCDNPPCVNPAHLFDGTRSTNMRDMVAKGRHPYDAVTKLTDAQVAEIRSRPSDAWGAKAALAREFGVSGNHIAWIISGKRRAA